MYNQRHFLAQNALQFKQTRQGQTVQENPRNLHSLPITFQEDKDFNR